MEGRRSGDHTARQIGIYDASERIPPQPLSSGPYSPPVHLYNSLPSQPRSLPHPSHGTHQEHYTSATSERPHSGSRYVSNPTREAIAQLIEGGEHAKSSHSSVGSVGSMRSHLSQHSAASFDPSPPITNERSWDSQASYVSRNTRSSGTGSALFEQSADNLHAGHGAKSRRSFGDDETPRESLPLELRSFGAPPEYNEVIRSPPTSQPSSSRDLHLGGPVAERYRRSSQPPSYPILEDKIKAALIEEDKIKAALCQPSHRYSVYLLYWYKSTNTDTALAAPRLPPCRHARSLSTHTQLLGFSCSHRRATTCSTTSAGHRAWKARTAARAPPLKARRGILTLSAASGMTLTHTGEMSSGKKKAPVSSLAPRLFKSLLKSMWPHRFPNRNSFMTRLADRSQALIHKWKLLV